MEWKPVVICPDPVLGDPLREALAEWRGVELKDYVAPEMALEIATRHESTVCFVDACTQPEAALALTTALAGSGRPVVLLERNEDAALLLRGFRAGAAEFLILPYGAAETAKVLERLASRTAGAPHEAAIRVFAIVAGKGSCGATTLAVALGTHLAATLTGRVLLADFDLLTGSVAFHLGLKPTFNTLDALADQGRLDDELWNRMVHTERKLEVLAAPEEPGGFTPGTGVTRLVDFWRQRYAVTLADCPLWSGELVCGVARQADRTIVVTGNSLAALHATRRTLVNLERMGISGGRVALVVSRYRASAGVDRETIERALGQPVLAVLPEDSAEAQRRLLEGGALGHGTDFGKAVERLAARLMETPGAQAEGRVASVAKIFAGVFKKR
jgi:pilus assembly protein CpaE